MCVSVADYAFDYNIFDNKPSQSNAPKSKQSRHSVEF